MIDIKTLTLPSHLRVLLLPRPTAESVTVMVLVRAGSRFETKSQNGIAHFLEHMFFKGGTRYPTARAVSEAIDSVGGAFNAFTSYEFVGYFVKVAKDHTELAFDVLSDMLLNAHLSQSDVDRERRVILEEYRMYLDNPRSLASTDFDNQIFGDHPLGWDIIGTPKNIQRFTSADLRAYKDTYYTAANIVIAVAGQADLSTVTKLVNRYFPYPSSKKINKPLPYPSKSPVKGTVSPVVKDTEQAHLILGTRSFGGNHKDRYVGEVLSAILGSGASSRLYSSIREELGLAYYVYAYQQVYTDTGYFAVAAGVDKERVDLAISQIFKELKEIAAHPVTPEELHKAQEYLIGHLMLELEHSDELAHLFGVKWLIYGKQADIEHIKSAIRSVTAPQIQRLAKKLFTEQSLALTVVGPKTLSGKIKQSYKLSTK